MKVPLQTKLPCERLSDLLSLSDSGTWGDPAMENDGVPVLRSTNIQDDCLVLDDVAYRCIPSNDLSRRMLSDGDIIVTASSGSVDHIGKCCLFSSPKDGRSYYFSNFTRRLRPNPKKLDSRWLFYWLSSDIGKFALRAMNDTTTGLRNINISRYLDQGIPLPPLPEQKRITAILDKADALRCKRQQAIDELNNLIPSIFYEIFGEIANNSKNWPIVTIRDLASYTQYGTSKKADTGGRHPILRMNNITRDGEWDFSDLKYIDLSEKETEKYFVHKGEILFNRTNSKELVGKTAVYRENEPMAYAGYLIKVKTNSKAHPEYISGYLNSKHGKHTLFNMCKSIIGMANINAQELQNIKICQPPLELQNKYAQIVADIRSHRKLHNSFADEAGSLFSSLVQRAFKGEL